MYYYYVICIIVVLAVVSVSLLLYIKEPNLNNKKNRMSKRHTHGTGFIFMTHKWDSMIEEHVEFLRYNLPQDWEFIIFIPRHNRKDVVPHIQHRGIKYIVGKRVHPQYKFDYDAHAEAWHHFWTHPTFEYYYFCEYDVYVQRVDWKLLQQWNSEVDTDFSPPFYFDYDEYSNETRTHWKAFKKKYNNRPFSITDKDGLCGCYNSFIRVRHDFINRVHEYLQQQKIPHLYMYNNGVPDFIRSMKNKFKNISDDRPPMYHFEVEFCSLSTVRIPFPEGTLLEGFTMQHKIGYDA